MRSHLVPRLLQFNPAMKVKSLFPQGVELDEEGRNQMILSGSIVVQSLLGETWNKSDVDIFCTWKSAPLVRQRLIKKFDLVRVPSLSPYMEGDINLRNPDSPAAAIHSVEVYKPRNKKKDYRTIDLVIGQPESHNALDIIKSFDLTICQSFFDGKNLKMLSPSHSLQGQTFVTKKLHSLLMNWLFVEEKHGACFRGIHTPLSIEHLLKKMNPKTWRDLNMVPHDDSFTAYCQGRTLYDLENKCTIVHYELISKHLNRIEKYAKRGIKVLNVPDTAINYFDSFFFSTKD